MELTAVPQQLTASAKVLADAATAIGTELQTLETASQALTGAWQGDAKVAYQQLYGSFTVDAAAQVATLKQIAVALAELAGEYSTTDEKGAAAVPAG